MAEQGKSEQRITYSSAQSPKYRFALHPALEAFIFIMFNFLNEHLDIDLGLCRITGNKGELWLLLQLSGNLRQNI
jgi:hypothetical protein